MRSCSPPLGNSRVAGALELVAGGVGLLAQLGERARLELLEQELDLAARLLGALRQVGVLRGEALGELRRRGLSAASRVFSQSAGAAKRCSRRTSAVRTRSVPSRRSAGSTPKRSRVFSTPGSTSVRLARSTIAGAGMPSAPVAGEQLEEVGQLGRPGDVGRGRQQEVLEVRAQVHGGREVAGALVEAAQQREQRVVGVRRAEQAALEGHRQALARLEEEERRALLHLLEDRLVPEAGEPAAALLADGGQRERLLEHAGPEQPRAGGEPRVERVGDDQAVAAEEPVEVAREPGPPVGARARGRRAGPRAAPA